MKVEDSTLAVVRALERMGVRHYVCGSLASSLHGDPRATNDADLVAELRPGDGLRLQQELGARFTVDVEEFESAVRNERSFNLIDEIELAKVDVFCVRAVDYQAEALGRTVRLELEPGDPFSQVAVASAEDTIVSKLRWYRLGGEVSDRQWNDVAGIVTAQRGRLDLAYLRRWAERLGVADLLERLLSS
ncbi:MAG: hypothetical protein AMXMBFR34_15390 [Myxococcaceae bacterium]